MNLEIIGDNEHIFTICQQTEDGVQVIVLMKPELIQRIKRLESIMPTHWKEPSTPPSQTSCPSI